MKTHRFFTLSFILINILSVLSVSAQSDVSELIKSSPADATKLANAYLNPLFKGFGIGLNSGWNNTANAKNLARFELRLSASGAFVPPSAKTFDITKIGLSNNVRPANSSQVISPTVAGKNSDGPQVDIYNGNQKIETLTLPQGANLPFVPAAQLQATVGLIKGIDITVRAMPEVKLGDVGSINMLGGGIKLELLPLIAGKTVGKLLPFDLAIALGYTRFNYELGLDVKPESGSVPKDIQQSQDFSDQRIDARFSGINVETILSKKLLFFIPFVSVGYNTSKTEVGLKGNYPIVTGVLLPSGTKTYTTFTDPVTINQNDIKGFKSTLGFQLNLAFFRIYSSYSFSEYNSFNAGVGIGIGK